MRTEKKFDLINTANNYNKITATRQGMYAFVYDSYWGERGYAHGRYLFKFDRESEHYDDRRLQAYYRNFIKGILNSIITPVFSEKPFVDCNNDLYESFAVDVDRKGSSIVEFVKSCTRLCKLQGVNFIIMDNYSELPKTRTETLESRKFPYVSYVTGEMVDKWELDLGKLKWISFRDGFHTGSDGEKIKRYRMWDSVKSYYFIYEKDDNDAIIREKVSDDFVHNLGKVPVIVTYSEEVNEFLPIPPFFDACRLNLAIYNQDSEQRSLERTNAFPILACAGDESESSIDIGSDSIYWYDKETSAPPEFVSPSSDILTILLKSAETNISSLIEQANILGSKVANQGSAKSGVAYGYEFMGQNFELKSVSKLATQIHLSIIDLLASYDNSTIDCEVKYNDNFAPTLQDIEKQLGLAERGLLLDISSVANMQIKNNVAELLGKVYRWNDDDKLAVKNSIIEEKEVL